MLNQRSINRLLAEQDWHLQQGYWRNFPEGFDQNTGRPLDQSLLEEWERKIDENEQKVIAAVKQYLQHHGCIITSIIEEGLREVNSSLSSYPDPLQGHCILYNWFNGHGNGSLAKPIFGGVEANKHFDLDKDSDLDKDLEYLTTKEAVEALMAREEVQFPIEIKLRAGYGFPGVPNKFQVGSRGIIVPGRNMKAGYAIFIDEDKMIDEMARRFHAGRL